MSLSIYVMTMNSERRIGEVLAAVAGLSDDVCVIDSGSTDATETIARRLGARFIYHRFENFTAQREFGVDQCRHEWVLALDSDEVVSSPLYERISALKRAGFDQQRQIDAYGIKREWFFLGHRVHCFYPSFCPDQPVRLFHKQKATYIKGKHIHENMVGFRKSESINESLFHYTCDSVDDLYAKLNQYSTLAALDLKARGETSHWMKIVFMPWIVAARWYLWLGGWNDGSAGIIHALFVHEMVRQKFLKLKFDLNFC